LVYKKVDLDNGVKAIIFHDRGSEVSLVSLELVDKLELDTIASRRSSHLQTIVS